MPVNDLICGGSNRGQTGRSILEKKRYTCKNTLITSPDTYIHYLGQTVGGSVHDDELVKKDLEVNLGLFEGYGTLVDLGYLGLNKDYFCATIHLPHRKPRKSKKRPEFKLTAWQKHENQCHARLRIKIEHALAGAKRLGTVRQVYRNKSVPFHDLVMCLACSLWNLHLNTKHHLI